MTHGRRYEVTLVVWGREQSDVRDYADHLRNHVPEGFVEDVGVIGVQVATVDMQPEPLILADHRADVRQLRVVQ